MQLFRKVEDIPKHYGPAVVTVGNFDGVHRAHRRVIDEIVKQAHSQHARSVAVTFEPHPVRILRPDADLKLLTPTPEKLRLLAETGLDAVLLLPFARDLSLLSPRDFVGNVLCEALHAREIHEGYNFRFGNKGAGDIALLTELGREFGFQVFAYSEMRLRGHEVSSSAIRRLLRNGQAHLARHLLGRVFSILSFPGRGRGFGSKYTVPTINLSRYEEIVPQDGVYITRTRLGEEVFDSVTNVGNRPTFGSESFAIETHLLNFHSVELSQESEVEIFFLRRIRPEITFPSVEALREQIAQDVKTARRYFHLAGRLKH